MKAIASLSEEKAGYHKVDPPCPYFGTCGGCALQDLSYADQLALKRERLRLALSPLGSLPPVELVAMDDPWRYRNKAEFTFSESHGELVLGYHAARSYWRVVDVDDCLLLPEPAMRVLRDVRRLAIETGLPAYHPKTHQGFFRYVLIRHSRATGRMLLGLITAPGPSEAVQDLARTVAARHPELVSVYWGISRKVADVAIPDELTLLQGSAYLEETVGPFRLQLLPLSFLQPNTQQAVRMYERLEAALRDVSAAVGWDLYCGVGLVALYLARNLRQVYAMDCEPHHVELARLNAAQNGLDNVDWRVGRVETLLMDRRFWLQEAKPDVIAVDPPRAGLHAQALGSLLAARPKRIAYLSCNAQTLVRDLRALIAGFPRYRIADVTAFDMFPQTNHVETLTILDRAKSP